VYVAAKPVHAVAQDLEYPGRSARGVSGQFHDLLPAASVCDTEAMKPLRCLLHLHVWHNYHNDEGQRYQLCTRCGAYREIYILTDYRAGSA
jgi:hypothetical protein